MSHPLTELRKRFNDLETEIKALQQAAHARREEAQAIHKELEAAALAGDTDATQEHMDSLRALENAHVENGTAVLQRQSMHLFTKDQIAGFYTDALNGGTPVDWSCTLQFEEKALYSGWSRDFCKGYIVILDVELCAPEIEALKPIIGTPNVVQEFNRIRVKENEYRRICWGDVDGRQIVKSLAPILDKREAIDDVSEFVNSLTIFK